MQKYSDKMRAILYNHKAIKRAVDINENFGFVILLCLSNMLFCEIGKVRKTVLRFDR